MKIVPKKKILVPTKIPVQAENQVKERKKKLPPDEYRDEIPQKRIDYDDTRHIIVSVKRGGEDGLPCLDLRWYQTTEVYTGFTKRGINIPIEYLTELIMVLNDVLDEVTEKGLLEED